MTDVFDKAMRSAVMAAVRGKNTGPEVRLAALLKAHGVRARRNVRTLPGTPDFVFKEVRTVVFLHGCFWHGHAACGKGTRLPQSNRAFWREKIERNRRRDRKARRLLRELGWSVLTFWECGLRKDRLPPRLARRLGPPRGV
ncbi:MAG TPA: DNA mismatch endonuclease Vsr, partial [Planctomycetota bacterium]|nr:DNA mismatch endonuclease Vsr [Planctomycetota bacterium]